MFEEPDVASKRMALGNPEYQQAFNVFDTDRSGAIDLAELSRALASVKTSVEAGTNRQMANHNFQPATIMMLAARFGTPNTGVIQFPQFAEMMLYIEKMKQLFQQIDTGRSGDIDVSEMSRALSMSGFNVSGYAGDPLSMQVAEKIGRAYDADGNGVLTFDEFVQLRLEWDYYIEAWDTHVPLGSTSMAPEQLLQVLEAVKHSLEPVGQLAMHPSLGFNGTSLVNNLYFNSMFQNQRPFLLRTCEMLIIRFGSGSCNLTFESFCMMMVFLQEQKKMFCSLDTARNGKLSLQELSTAFAKSGLLLPTSSVMEIGRRFDQDNSGYIEFDEFLQMMIEWTQVASYQSQFNGYCQQRADANSLQSVLSSIQVFFFPVNGRIPVLRPFSLSTCRWLISMFGTCMPGEAFARSVSYEEYLQLMQWVKQTAASFSRCDITGDGSISAQELQMALGYSGLNVPPQALLAMMNAYDYDRSGRIEFDEFLQMVLEAQMYDRRVKGMACFNAASQTITMDPASFFGMLYSTPRSFSSLRSPVGTPI